MNHYLQAEKVENRFINKFMKNMRTHLETQQTHLKRVIILKILMSSQKVSEKKRMSLNQ